MKEKCYYVNPLKAMSLGITGIAGFHFWSGFQRKEDGSYYTDLWKDIFRSQAHMNGADVINTLSQNWGLWHHGMQKTFLKFPIGSFRYKRPDLIEEQNYISDDKTKFVGYVRNRTFNARTKGCYGLTFPKLDYAPYFYLNISILWNQPPLFNRIKVNGLQSGEHYTIHWFSFKYGNYIKTDCLKANNGSIRLEYPWLTSTAYETTDNPVVWFVAQKSDCNKNKSSLDSNSTATLINKLNKSPQNTIYPNPFDEFFIVKSIQNDTFILQAVDGRILGKYKIEKGETKISRNLTKGIYIGTFQNQSQTFKLLKK